MGDEPDAAPLQVENKTALQAHGAYLEALVPLINSVEKFAVFQFTLGNKRCIKSQKEVDQYKLSRDKAIGSTQNSEKQKAHSQRRGPSF